MSDETVTVATLTNEADVEACVVEPLLRALGYKGKAIRRKQSLKQLLVRRSPRDKGSRYAPDFAIVATKKLRLLVEAKSPSENLDDHTWQPRAYGILLNGEEDPSVDVSHYVLTNGRETRLYDIKLNRPLYQSPTPVIALDIDELATALADINAKNLGVNLQRDRIVRSTMVLRKVSIAEANAVFSSCHQIIYRKDNISQAAGFSEFVKIIALKLLSDRKIRDNIGVTPDREGNYEVPTETVEFSTTWIEQNGGIDANPLNKMRFRTFMEEMERDIALGKRKRIFDRDEEIRLKPETIYGVVKRLEELFLLGIDADLNGRLFETFLNATMRGKDLGQFFTPRSVIKLGIKLANPQVAQKTIAQQYPPYNLKSDLILDGCCGTGGFLIDALSEMWAKVDDRKDLSPEQKKWVRKDIADNCIFGIDVAQDPKLSRIARLNMFLHGDGGSKIFHLDALDKHIAVEPADSAETAKEKEEFTKLTETGRFDLVLTNPPFAKALDKKSANEKRILDQYTVSNAFQKKSVRSSLLFIERYHELLRDGGLLLTVIDDGILSGTTYAAFRNDLRRWFIIKAIVSLPGDAFQRSNARVKTSFLLLQKRAAGDQSTQPDAFVYPCRSVGVDDPKRQRMKSSDPIARRDADEEIEVVAREFERFSKGFGNDKFTVPGPRLLDRLDAKACLFEPNSRARSWLGRGLDVKRLDELVQERPYDPEEKIEAEAAEGMESLIVKYDGSCLTGPAIDSQNSSYAYFWRVATNDIVLSNISAALGAVTVITPDVDGALVSNEYTVLRALPDVDPYVVTAILRSSRGRAEMLLSATGANRTRVSWTEIRSIHLPFPKKCHQSRLTDLKKEKLRLEKELRASVKQEESALYSALDLDDEDADVILAAFKPPK